MAVVPGGDRHRVDLVVLEDLARVGGGVAELIALGERLGVHAARCADGDQAQLLERVKMRKKHGFRVVSGADHAEPDFSQRCSAVEANGARFAFERAVVGIRVLEHDADGAGEIAICDSVEHIDRVVELEAVGDQVRWVDPALGDQVEKRGDVSLRRPAHIADGIVVALGEVVRIVDAGAGRAAEQEFDLLAEPQAPVEIDLGVAEAHDATAVTDEQGGHLDRLIILGGRGQEDHVHPGPMTDATRGEERCALVGGTCDFGAGGKRQLAFLGVEIDAHDPAAIGAAQLHGELTEQAEADHRNAHAELKPRLAQALERDGADGARACSLEAHVARHRRDEGARHGVIFGMGGDGLADAGDAIADAELIDL